MDSRAVYESMCRIIPGGVNSPVRSGKSVGHLPLVVDSAYGETLVDVDGRHYLDFCGSWGALIHGHAHPTIIEAVKKRMEKGTSFGATTALEGELAAEVVKLIDSIEKIRFVSSGTEATMSALRLARGFTKRDVIIKFAGNYHGHADTLLVQAGSGVLEHCPQASSDGVPQEFVKHTLSLPYNDIEACERAFAHPDYQGRIAAVIVEPVAGNMGVVPGDPLFLKALRTLTEKNGALLIFDEVITGFRVHLKGAQHLYNIRPDLTCLGKIIGGGFPVAAFGGRADIMDCLAPLGGVYQAGTLSGNPVAMEAGLQSLRLLQRPKFYEEMEAKTERFLSPIRKAMAGKGCVQQVGSMFTLFFGVDRVRNVEEASLVDKEAYAAFFRALFKEGIYFPPAALEAAFISSVHTEESLDRAANIIVQECLRI